MESGGKSERCVEETEPENMSVRYEAWGPRLYMCVKRDFRLKTSTSAMKKREILTRIRLGERVSI